MKRDAQLGLPFYRAEAAQVQVDLMGDTGFEPLVVSSIDNKELENKTSEGAAESGAVGAGFVSGDPDLDRIVHCWHHLQEDVKEAVMALVNAANVT